MLSASRSRLLWIAAAALVLAGLGLAFRYWLPGYAVRSVLGLMGASEIHFSEARGTPWRLEIDELRFRMFTQDFAARRVMVEREQWWTASLGRVRVEGASLPAVLDGSNVDPWNWSAGHDAGLGDEPVSLPFHSLDLDGELVVRMATVPDRSVTVKLEARPKSGTSWIGSLVAEGEGFRLAGGGSLLRAGQELDFQVHTAELDLQIWSAYIQRLVTLPGAPWTMGGKLTGVGEGKVTAKRFAATARVSLRDGRMRAGTRDIAAEGAEAELEFSDLWKFRTKSGALRVKEVRVGRLPLTEVAVDFGLWGGQTVIVNGAVFQALGGRARVQPFRYNLYQREVAATVDAENLDLARVMALTSEVPVQLAGRVDGTLPLRIEDSGVRLGHGHLGLPLGAGAELRLSAAQLLRSGATMPVDTLAVLKAAGNEPLAIRLAEMRLDIRPPDLPLGNSGRLFAAGDTEKGPLSFTFNVNGSVEKYLRVLP